jgi:hypothetical protein
MSTFNPDKKELTPKAFELYRVKHKKTNLYWSGKGFDEKDKTKSKLVDFRLLASLKWEHVYVEFEVLVSDRRKDETWAHLVSSLSSCSK